jgi:prophage antirepressor-like protein
MSNIIKFDQFNITTEVKFEDGEFWLTQKQLAELFGIDVKTISFHLVNMKEDGELPDSSVLYYQIIAESSFSGQKEVAHYNQDVAYDLGFRVRNSALAKKFRSYTKEILKRELKEQSNPSLIVERGVDAMKDSGASNAQVIDRVESKLARRSYTDEIAERDSKKNIGLHTNQSYLGMTGKKADKLKADRNKENKRGSLRDFMTETELAAVRLNELLAIEKMRAADARGKNECASCCYAAGTEMSSVWNSIQTIKGIDANKLPKEGI